MKHQDKDEHIYRSRRRWLAGKLRAVVKAIGDRQAEEMDDTPRFERWEHRKERAA